MNDKGNIFFCVVLDLQVTKCWLEQSVEMSYLDSSHVIVPCLHLYFQPVQSLYEIESSGLGTITWQMVDRVLA